MNPESPTGRRRAADRAAWVKSSYSMDNGHCVEISHERHAVAVRDSKNTTAPAITYLPGAWHTFLKSL